LIDFFRAGGVHFELENDLEPL